MLDRKVTRGQKVISGYISLIPLRVELSFFGARWTALCLTFLCVVETKLERNPLIIDVCSNCLAKYLVGTHFQNTWAQSVRNRRDNASFEANFLSLSEQAICLKDLYLLTEAVKTNSSFNLELEIAR